MRPLSARSVAVVRDLYDAAPMGNRSRYKMATAVCSCDAGGGCTAHGLSRRGLATVLRNEFGEGFELLLKQGTRRLVLQLARLFVEFCGAAADKDFRLVEGERVQKHHHLAQVVLNPRSTQGTGRGRLNGQGLAGEWLIGQARDPVDCVLQSTGQGEIVFGRAEDDTVSGPDRIREDIHWRREPGRILNVGIIDGKFSEG